ncbi:anti-sigma factor [Neolewinella sp.]|uniref:anti-sigma factor n=1 Tax=Neolewinella sp. TaxID=2993543 RepID=UPI003B529E22
MDIQAYINSGVLELYVLDRLSPDERRQVETYAEQYPDVRQEIEEIELALEEYAILNGQLTPPAPTALTAVLAALPTTTAAARPTAAKNDPPPPRRPNWPLWLLALALGMALFGLYYFYQQAQRRGTSIGELQQRFTTLEQDCERIRDNNQENRQQLALLSDADTRGIVLAGSDNAPDSRAVVFYNQQAGEVLFSAANLPAPPAGKQYQLWAIDANGPQDLGVLDEELTSDTLLDVRFIPNAAAFAITLEDAGGKPSPDLSQLQVIGEVPTAP